MPNKEILAVMERADLLFLPLAFDSPYPEVIRTSSPGKFGEYLQSGVPILAHAPDDSYVIDYIRRNDCGFVESSRDIGALAGMLRIALYDDRLRVKKVTNAYTAAKEFSPELSLDAFNRALAEYDSSKRNNKAGIGKAR